MNLAEYKGVYVFAQQVDNQISSIALELIGKGKDLAKDLGTTVTAVLVGSNVKGLADELGEYGADKVIVVDDPELKDYRTEPYTHAITSVINEFKPDIFLIGATAIGRDLGPRVCARIHTGLTADCTQLDIGDFPLVAMPGKEQKHNQLLMTRPAFGGNTIATIVNFSSQLPGKIWTWLCNTASKVVSWGSDLMSKGREAANKLVNAVLNGVRNLPSQMMSVGRNIVTGVWNGICNAAGWFRSQVRSFFSGIVDGVKGALGIHSPSRVFAKEVGRWIPPGVGVGIEDSMPDLEKQTDKEMEALADRMQAAVNVETGKITLDKNTSQTYKVEQENGQSFVESKTEVVIEGETHVHVDLDEKEIGHATTPIVDNDMGRLDTHKKRGG